MILSAFGSSGLSHCLGDCSRAVMFLPPVCGRSRQCFLLRPIGCALFSCWLSYSVPFPCIFHGLSVFAASLAQEHQAPVWLFSCSACCSWVMFPGPRCGPDSAHMDMNRDTRTHTHVHIRANLAQDGAGRLAWTLLPQPPFHCIQLTLRFH